MDLLTSQPNDHLDIIFSFFDGLEILRGLSVSKRYSIYSRKYYAAVTPWLNAKMQRSIVEGQIEQIKRYVRTPLNEVRIHFNCVEILDMLMTTQCFNLKVLLMSNCRLKDEHLVYLSHLPRLEKLDIGFNQITDVGLKNISALSNLEVLDISALNIYLLI
jgi:hypothetical protein